MAALNRLLGAFVIAGLLPSLLAAPAPQMNVVPNLGNSGPVGGVVIAGLLPSLLAAPAPQMNVVPNLGNSGPVGGVTISPEPTQTATSTSGSLRGGNLIGGVGGPGITALPVTPTSADTAVVSNYQLVNGQDADADLGLYLDFAGTDNPQPLRGSEGQTDPGPRTYGYDKLNPDTFAPPGTDSGDVPQAKWPLGLSHNRFGTGGQSGWARQQNIDVLPSATKFAGVDMRLAPYAYRELHWHTANEWSLMLKGCVRLAAVNEDGKTFLDDICEGDVWFFPAGVPHSIQALDQGCEFLLIFDDGSFSEDGTFLASELFIRNPKEVLSKNFQTPVSSFDNLPTGQKYIFPGTPPPADISQSNVSSPYGQLSANDSYTYHFSQQAPYTVPGGSVKILDSTTFPISKDVAVALVTVQPGAMREMHWHTTYDEWNYFLSGSARITVYLAPQSSRTFDFTAGDVGYIPASNAHYIENTGDTDVVFLEVLNAAKFSDISVSQWLALTPSQVVVDTLGISKDVIDAQPKAKSYIKTGNRNMTALAANPNGTAAYQ